MLFSNLLPEVKNETVAAVSCVFVAVMLLLINIAIWIIVFAGVHIKKDKFAAKPVNFEVLKVGSGGRINDVSAFAAKPVNFAAKPVNFAPVRVLGNGMVNDISGFAAKPVNFEVKQDGAHSASFEVGNPYESVHE